MRAAVLLAMLAASGCAAPGAAPPPATPGPIAADAGATTWSGQMRCDPIPGLTTRNLVQPVQLVVEGAQARFDRTVRRGDQGGDSDVQEHASGTVSPDGTVTLASTAQAASLRYTGEYSGRLPPGASSARLTGVQHWSGQRFASVDRPCTIVLRR